MDQALALAGDLGDEDARARFRRFLEVELKDLEEAREFLGNCLGLPDSQNRLALWDLICHIGTFLGFEVDFEGKWISPKGVLVHLAFEPPAGSVMSAAPVVSTEPAGLAGSVGSVGVEALVAKIGAIDSEEAQEIVVGLYVVCASDLESTEDAVIKGDETGQIRAVSAESLLSLAEMVIDYDLSHEDTLLIILSSGALVDPLIDLMGRIIARCEAEIPSLEEIASALEPFTSSNKMSTDTTLQDMIEQGQYYAFGNDAAKNRMLRR